MKEGWMKNDDEWWRMNERWKDEWKMKDEWWMMNDEGWCFQAVEGFCRQTDRRTDICECRVAFATENMQWLCQNTIMSQPD